MCNFEHISVFLLVLVSFCAHYSNAAPVGDESLQNLNIQLALCGLPAPSFYTYRIGSNPSHFEAACFKRLQEAPSSHDGNDDDAIENLRIMACKNFEKLVLSKCDPNLRPDYPKLEEEYAKFWEAGVTDSDLCTAVSSLISFNLTPDFCHRICGDRNDPFNNICVANAYIMHYSLPSQTNNEAEKKPEDTDNNVGESETGAGNAQDPINTKTSELPVEGKPTADEGDQKEQLKKETPNDQDPLKEEEDQEGKPAGGSEGQTGVDAQNQLTGDHTGDTLSKTKTNEVIEPITESSQQNPPVKENPPLNTDHAGPTGNNDDQTYNNPPGGNDHLQPNNPQTGDNGGPSQTGNVIPQNGPPYNIPGGQPPAYDPSNPQNGYNNVPPQTGGNGNSQYDPRNNVPGGQPLALDPNNPQNAYNGVLPQTVGNGNPQWNPNNPPNGYNGNQLLYPAGGNGVPVNGNNGGQPQPFNPNYLPNNGYNGNPLQTGGNTNPQYDPRYQTVNNGGLPGYNYPPVGANGNPMNPQAGPGNQPLQGNSQTDYTIPDQTVNGNQPPIDTSKTGYTGPGQTANGDQPPIDTSKTGYTIPDQTANGDQPPLDTSKTGYTAPGQTGNGEQQLQGNTQTGINTSPEHTANDDQPPQEDNQNVYPPGQEQTSNGGQLTDKQTDNELPSHINPETGDTNPQDNTADQPPEDGTYDEENKYRAYVATIQTPDYGIGWQDQDRELVSRTNNTPGNMVHIEIRTDIWTWQYLLLATSIIIIIIMAAYMYQLYHSKQKVIVVSDEGSFHKDGYDKLDGTVTEFKPLLI